MRFIGDFFAVRKIYVYLCKCMCTKSFHLSVGSMSFGFDFIFWGDFTDALYGMASGVVAGRNLARERPTTVRGEGNQFIKDMMIYYVFINVAIFSAG